MYVLPFDPGDLTRYRPHHFGRFLESKYGRILWGASRETGLFLYNLAIGEARIKAVEN